MHRVISNFYPGREGRAGAHPGTKAIVPEIGGVVLQVGSGICRAKEGPCEDFANLDIYNLFSFNHKGIAVFVSLANSLPET